MLLAATEGGICWLTFGNERGAMLEELRAAFPKARLRNDEARLYSWFEAVRAVASACSRNHLALLIPCHRVVGADGSLSGYRWGVDRKRVLLDREARSGEDAPDAAA